MYCTIENLRDPSCVCNKVSIDECGKLCEKIEKISALDVYDVLSLIQCGEKSDSNF